jgi:hypothetical protein
VKPQFLFSNSPSVPTLGTIRRFSCSVQNFPGVGVWDHHSPHPPEIFLRCRQSSPLHWPLCSFACNVSMETSGQVHFRYDRQSTALSSNYRLHDSRLYIQSEIIVGWLEMLVCVSVKLEPRQGPVAGSCVHGDEPIESTKEEHFLTRCVTLAFSERTLLHAEKTQTEGVWRESVGFVGSLLGYFTTLFQ